MTDFEYRDRDGVVWRIVWRAAGADARVVNGEHERASIQGFEFTCAAATFHVPWPTYTDPRAIRPRVLQRMVDRALEGR